MKRSRSSSSNQSNKAQKVDALSQHESEENQRLREENQRLRGENERLREEMKHYVTCKFPRCNMNVNHGDYIISNIICITCQHVECTNGKHSDTVPCPHCGDLGRSHRGKTTKKKTITTLTSWPEHLKFKPYDNSLSWTDTLPLELWTAEIIPYLNVKDLTRSCSIETKFFKHYFDTFLAKNQICVPKDVPELVEALDIGRHFRNRYTNDAPLVIQLSEGTHGLVGCHLSGTNGNRSMYVRYNVSIIGAGRDKSIVKCGFQIDNAFVTLFTVTDLTISGLDENSNQLWNRLNKIDQGIYCHNASVVLNNVNIEYCQHEGMYLWNSHRSKMTNCQVSRCNGGGLNLVDGLVTIDGDTSIQDNTSFGLNVRGTTSTVQLISPLTLVEMVQHNCMIINSDNGDTDVVLRNWDGSGIIKENETVVYQIMPEDLDDEEDESE